NFSVFYPEPDTLTSTVPFRMHKSLSISLRPPFTAPTPVPVPSLIWDPSFIENLFVYRKPVTNAMFIRRCIRNIALYPVKVLLVPFAVGDLVVRHALHVNTAVRLYSFLPVNHQK